MLRQWSTALWLMCRRMRCLRLRSRCSSNPLHELQVRANLHAMKTTIKIGTLAERLAASAAVPLEEALAGVRAHGPQPTREPPEVAALKFFQNSMPASSPKAYSTSNTETVPSTMPALIPQRIG